MNRFSFLWLPVALVLLMAGCKPSVPRRYIQPDRMAEILYDYHLADGMAMEQQGDNHAYDSRLYRLAALKKHGVSQADFDSSMVYYTRHADRLHDIYVKVAERMEREATALGASVNSLAREGLIEGDVVNIWPAETSVVLMPIAPYNHLQCRVEADTTFHAGERFSLSFDTQFIFQDGSRNGVAQLVVRFRNDSVATRMIHLSSSSHYSLEILDPGKRGVEAVEGLFYLGTNRNASQTTLKLMAIDHLKLVKVMMEEAKKDSIAPHAAPDGASIDKEADTIVSPTGDESAATNVQPLNGKGKLQEIRLNQP